MRALLVSAGLLAAFLGVLLPASGCSGTIQKGVAGGAGGGGGTTTTGTGGVGGTGPGCGAGPAICAGACVDLGSDPANCGSCGHACPSGVGCKGGACAAAACKGVMGFPGVPEPGVSALAVAVADVNGDGKPDLVALDGAGVEVLLGRGDGTFGAPVTYPQPPLSGALTLADIAVGDLNGDGWPEVVVTSDFGVTMLSNDGAGGFVAPTSLTLAIHAYQIAVRDLDGDGHADLVLADGSGVGVLRNLGAGTFAAPVLYPAACSAQPGSLAVGDVDGDGHLDVLVVGAKGVVVLRNQGTGTLAAGVVYPVTGSTPLTMGMGDLDGDGKPDLAVFSEPDAFDVLHNLGGGVFAPPVQHTGPMGATWIGVTDLNGDGLVDVLHVAEGGLTVSLSAGGGAFAAPAAYWEPAAYWLVAADLDGSGRPDLVTRPVGQELVEVVLNRGDGTLVTGVAHSLASASGDRPGDVATADLDGDGLIDLAVADQDSGKVRLLRGQGDGSFDSGSDLAVLPGGTRGILVADVDGDTLPDLVVETLSPAGWSVLRNLGKGAFGAPVAVAPGLRSLQVANISGHGPHDLAGVGPLPDQVTLLSSMGGGGFYPPSVVSVSGAGAVAVADFDADGTSDLAVLTNTGVETLRGQGDGTWLPWNQVSGPGTWSMMEVADVDGDGEPDLVLGGPNTLAVVLNKGGHALGAPTSYPLGLTPGQPVYQMRLVDLDGDGALDVAMSVAKSGPLVVLRNQGSGTFGPPLYYTAGWSTGSLAAADLNRDGRMDLVIIDGETLDSQDPGPGYPVAAVLLGACLP